MTTIELKQNVRARYRVLRFWRAFGQENPQWRMFPQFTDKMAVPLRQISVKVQDKTRISH
jgi:hypothetical protein